MTCLTIDKKETPQHPQMKTRAEPGKVVIMRIRGRHNTHRVTQKECLMMSVVRLSEAFEIR